MKICILAWHVYIDLKHHNTWQESLGIKTTHLPWLLAPISIPNPRYLDIEKTSQTKQSIATIERELIWRKNNSLRGKMVAGKKNKSMQRKKKSKKAINNKEKKPFQPIHWEGKRNNKLHKAKQHNKRQTKLYLRVKEESHEKTKSMNRKTVPNTASFTDHCRKQQLINMPFCSSKTNVIKD